MKVFLLLLLVSLLSACKGSNGDVATTSTHAATVAAPASPPIYPLALTLTDFDSASIGLDVFRGHPVVVSMFYGSCPAACPLIVSHIKEIEAALPGDVRADLRVLLVSFDPDRDTPTALHALADAHHVDVARWRFATGSDDTVRQLANVLGVDYRRGEDGIFSHNSVISVLDREGRVVARSDDPSAPLDPLIAAARSTR